MSALVDELMIFSEKGDKPTWIKRQPRQRIWQCNTSHLHTVTLVFDKEVKINLN